MSRQLQRVEARGGPRQNVQMQSPDYKFWAGIGLALVGLAPIPDGLRIICLIVGAVLIFVSAAGSIISSLMRRFAAVSTAPDARNFGNAAARDLAALLDQFFQTGVKERNRLLRAVQDFDYAHERSLLVDWSDRVVKNLESALVTIGERSRFETLNQYVPDPLSRESMSEGQLHIHTMWTEKLKRLRSIIDRVGD